MGNPRRLNAEQEQPRLEEGDEQPRSCHSAFVRYGGDHRCVARPSYREERRSANQFPRFDFQSTRASFELTKHQPTAGLPDVAARVVASAEKA
jgi:hypothetical protein